jgi:hypothetical protein
VLTHANEVCTVYVLLLFVVDYYSQMRGLIVLLYVLNCEWTSVDSNNGGIICIGLYCVEIVSVDSNLELNLNLNKIPTSDRSEFYLNSTSHLFPSSLCFQLWGS